MPGSMKGLIVSTMAGAVVKDMDSQRSTVVREGGGGSTKKHKK